MNTEQIKQNYQTMNLLLTEFQNNMNSAIPDIYLKLSEAEKQKTDFGQELISDIFWSSFALIGGVEALPGKEIVSWLLNAAISDIHDNLSNYPDLSSQIEGVYERMEATIYHIKADKIAPVVDNPEAHYNDTYKFKDHIVKVSDFENFDIVYAGVGYNNALNAITKQSKSDIVKTIFPYDKWKIAFWFGESPSNPCRQCDWGCDDWIDTRGFVEDKDAPILDYDGKVLAKNLHEWVSILNKDNHNFYVIENVLDYNSNPPKNHPNAKIDYPNGAMIHEYILVWGRDDFLNDWQVFPEDVGQWMFYNNSVGDVSNIDGFVDRYEFYRNWGLDAANCMYKKQYPPDPNN